MRSINEKISSHNQAFWPCKITSVYTDVRKPGLSIRSSEITARTRSGIVHSGGGALCASDLVEEVLDEKDRLASKKDFFVVNRQLGLPTKKDMGKEGCTKEPWQATGTNLIQQTRKALLTGWSCYRSFHTKLSNLSLCYGLASSILSFLGLRSISALLLFLCYGSLRLLEKAPILKLSVNYVLLPRLKEIQSQSHSSSDSAVS
ncbi:hypothetical protein Lal_00001722 [Lupinus albus]|nr:hypothetical protein Lal_00001722 [Lupinus albus]